MSTNKLSNILDVRDIAVNKRDKIPVFTKLIILLHFLFFFFLCPLLSSFLSSFLPCFLLSFLPSSLLPSSFFLCPFFLFLSPSFLSSPLSLPLCFPSSSLPPFPIFYLIPERIKGDEGNIFHRIKKLTNSLQTQRNTTGSFVGRKPLENTSCLG